MSAADKSTSLDDILTEAFKFDPHDDAGSMHPREMTRLILACLTRTPEEGGSRVDPANGGTSPQEIGEILRWAGRVRQGMRLLGLLKVLNRNPEDVLKKLMQASKDSGTPFSLIMKDELSREFLCSLRWNSERQEPEMRLNADVVIRNEGPHDDEHLPFDKDLWKGASFFNGAKPDAPKGKNGKKGKKSKRES